MNKQQIDSQLLLQLYSIINSRKVTRQWPHLHIDPSNAVKQRWILNVPMIASSTLKMYTAKFDIITQLWISSSPVNSYSLFHLIWKVQDVSLR